MRNKISIVFLAAAFGSALFAPHAEAVVDHNEPVCSFDATSGRGTATDNRPSEDANVVKVPPGETRTVRLRLTPRGKRIVNSGTKRILSGVLEIRNSSGGIQNTPIRIRIKVRR